MLYTAKGAGALLVPIAAGIAKANGWGPVFILAMSFNITAALLALFVLKPMRVKHFAKSRAEFPTSMAAPAAAVTATPRARAT